MLKLSSNNMNISKEEQEEERRKEQELFWKSRNKNLRLMISLEAAGQFAMTIHNLKNTDTYNAEIGWKVAIIINLCI